MTPAELELLRKVVREETGRTHALPQNGRWRTLVEIIAASGGVLVIACAIAAYLLVPRTEAAAQHQEIKDSVVNERAVNLLQEQHLVTLDATLSELKEDVKSIGRKVGARVK